MDAECNQVSEIDFRCFEDTSQLLMLSVGCAVIHAAMSYHDHVLVGYLINS